MLTDQRPGGLLHGCGVQRFPGPADTTMQQSGTGWARQDHIPITACGSTETSIEIRRHRAHPGDRDIVRQIRGGAEQPAVQIPLHLGIEMHDLPRRVDAGIGSTCAGDGDWMIGNPGQRPLQGFLHRHRMPLGLPAGITTTVILNTEG